MSDLPIINHQPSEPMTDERFSKLYSTMMNLDLFIRSWNDENPNDITPGVQKHYREMLGEIERLKRVIEDIAEQIRGKRYEHIDGRAIAYIVNDAGLLIKKDEEQVTKDDSPTD